MTSVEQRLVNAACGGHPGDVQAILKDHPGVDVNWKDQGWSALHWASRNGLTETVQVLLAHPAIKVNVLTIDKTTPFLLACANDKVEVVRLLLKDRRVDITLGDCNGCTALWWAAFFGRLGVIEWLMASGRDLGDLNKNIKYWGDDGKEYSAIDIASNMGKTEVASLLEKCIANPTQTRQEVRAKLGLLDGLAAEVFALTVFLCDGLLQLKRDRSIPKNSTMKEIPATRFFVIVFQLPMELQMVLCRRAVGSMKENILHEDSEAAFKSLAEILLGSSKTSKLPLTSDSYCNIS